MRIGIVKPGKIIARSKCTAGWAELEGVVNVLIMMDVEVFIITGKVDDCDRIFGAKYIELDISFTDIVLESLKLDCLLVFNGIELDVSNSTNAICTHEIINNYSGKVFFCLTDIELAPKAKYYNRSMTCLVNSYNIDALKTYINDTDSLFKFDDYVFYPFDLLPLINEEPNIVVKSSYYADLIYGGYFRSGLRKENMIKYLFGFPVNIDVAIFGDIKIDDFSDIKHNMRLPEFANKVSADDFYNKMRDSLSTIVFNDELHNKFEMFSQRICQSILVGVVVFIDSNSDMNKRIFGSNSMLRYFNYVDTKAELINKIQFLKHQTSFEFISELLNQQYLVISNHVNTKRLLDLPFILQGV